MSPRSRTLALSIAVAGTLALPAGTGLAQGSIAPQTMADALHAVMAADRTVYTRLIVNRLQNEEKLIKATEHWKDDKSLVLPAQMFRYGGEEVAKTNKNSSYALLSSWPVNKQNAPRTDGSTSSSRTARSAMLTVPVLAYSNARTVMNSVEATRLITT